MAPKLCLVVVGLLLVAASPALAGDSECAEEFSCDCEQTWAVEDGKIVQDGVDREVAAAWAAQLAETVSQRVHKDKECSIAQWTLLKACRTADDEVHMFFEHQISCPDNNGFKVKYETKGKATADDNAELEDPNTRFVCVFDSTFA